MYVNYDFAVQYDFRDKYEKYKNMVNLKYEKKNVTISDSKSLMDNKLNLSN